MLMDQQAAAIMVVVVEVTLRVWLGTIMQVQGGVADHTAGLPGIEKLHRSV